MSVPTRNESTDNAWARDKVQEWVDNVEGMYGDTQILARTHPVALGVYVVGVLYGDASRDFPAHELEEMNATLASFPEVRGLLEHVQQERPDSPDRLENETRGYVADSLARRDVQGIDWAQLALDLADVEPGDEDAPEWVKDYFPQAGALEPGDSDDLPDPAAMSALAKRAFSGS